MSATPKGLPREVMSRVRTRLKRLRRLRTALFALENAGEWARSAVGGRGGRSLSPERDAAPSYFLTAMVRAKDEARFLPEWIAHHVCLGVEHVFVYDNNSTDRIAEALRPFVERGLATHIPWPNVPAAPSCLHDFLARFGTCSEWVAFFDVDEFLFEPGGKGRLKDLLRATPAPALAVNWRYFGSAGHSTIPCGLVTARFDRAAARFDHHVKVIARPGKIREYRNSHNFFYAGGRLARACDGRRVWGSFSDPAGMPDLVLHHYVYRSREDYDRKSRRGFVDSSGSREAARRAEFAESEFRQHNDRQVHVPPEVLTQTSRMLRYLGFPSDHFESARPAVPVGE